MTINFDYVFYPSLIFFYGVPAAVASWWLFKKAAARGLAFELVSGTAVVVAGVAIFLFLQ